MRKSLVRSTILLVLLAVIAVAVPIALFAQRSIHNQERYRIEVEAERIAEHFTEEIVKGDPLEQEVRDDVPPNSRLELRLADGRRMSAGPTTHFAAEIVVTVDGPDNSLLTLATSGKGADSRTITAFLVIGGISLLVILSAGLLAWWEARRLTAPLAKVVAAADQMGAGDLSTRAPSAGLPEVDAVVDALNRLADRVNELVRAEREFSSNASHQLRSGLTSLRLRLETLTQTAHDDVRGDAIAALRQAEKLSDTVADLLRLARTGRAGEASRYDLARVVRHHAARVEPALHTNGRELRINGEMSAEVIGSPSAVGEAIDVLLSNAVVHGEGVVTVDVTADNGSLAVTVADEGRGLENEVLPGLFVRHPDSEGHGIGLALARTLVEAEGGRLELVHARPPVFRLLLPKSREAQPLTDR